MAFDLTEAADRPLKTSSGGMRAASTWPPRWSTARPPVLFLDEPTNAARSLMLGPDATAALERTGQFQSSSTSYVIQAVLWISAVLAVAAPLAVRRYRRTV